MAGVKEAGAPEVMGWRGEEGGGASPGHLAGGGRAVRRLQESLPAHQPIHHQRTWLRGPPRPTSNT